MRPMAIAAQTSRPDRTSSGSEDQERMGEALDKVFRKIVGDDELWERRKAEMVAGRRWAELLY